MTTFSPTAAHVRIAINSYMQQRLEHGADHDDPAAWEVDVDQTVTAVRWYKSVLTVAAIKRTSLLALAFDLDGHT
jgi:hypothetical protein